MRRGWVFKMKQHGNESEAGSSSRAKAPRNILLVDESFSRIFSTTSSYSAIVLNFVVEIYLVLAINF
jgi:hypothetical protein